MKKHMYIHTLIVAKKDLYFRNLCIYMYNSINKRIFFQ